MSGQARGPLNDVPPWRRFLRFWGPSLRADVDEELAFHLEHRTRDLEARGVPTRRAREEAERQFGDLVAIRDACITIDARRYRRANRLEALGLMLLDVKHALRALRKSPAFTVMAVICIALGVGVTTTIFTAVNGILLRPLPYPNADRLVAIYSQLPARNERGINISWNDFISWRDQNHTVSSIGIWTWTTHTLTGGGGDAERVEGAALSVEMLPMIGVRPALGRVFAASEDRPGAEHVVMLGYGLWQRRYSGDSAIVGRAIDVDGAPATVVGIMPPRFNYPERGQMWVPFAADPAREGRGNRGYAGALGRLKPNVTFEQANADLHAISVQLQRDFPVDNTGWETEALPLRDDLVGNLKRPTLVFLGAVILVLLIACSNVANLMLVRAAARQRELAVRLAIGGGRGRIVRQVLTESLALAFIGGALGAFLSRAGVRLLSLAFPNNVPFYISFALDRTVLLFAVGISALTGILFGILPAYRSTQLDPGSALREGGRTGSEGPARSRLRGVLVVAEIALSLVVTVSALLLVRSLEALQHTTLGFQERGVLTMRVTLPQATYGERSKRIAYFSTVLEKLRALPGVRAVGSANGTPFSGWDVQGEISVEGQPPPRPGEDFISHYQNVTPGFFQALGVPLVLGRGLTMQDRDSTAVNVVVNETFVRRRFPNESPLGRRVRIGGVDSKDPWATIVGVVADFRHYRLPQPMGPAIYFPYFSWPGYTQTLVINTSLADANALMPAVRDVLRGADAHVPPYRVLTMEEAVARSLWRQRFQSEVLGVFAVLALLLATVGMYGVISYAVAQRSRELSVRVALGATSRHVTSLIVGQGTRLAVLGVAIGLAVSFAVTRVLRQLLYGVTATDPFTFIVVPITLGAIAILASWIPARRAVRVDPVESMRGD